MQKGLQILGLDVVSKIQRYIESGIPPELQSRKGTPLIDTGQLINSITFKVSTPGVRA